MWKQFNYSTTLFALGVAISVAPVVE